jgi:23S rRNA (guanine745-N1)-methyltransferase
MVEARSAFLAAGHFDPLAEAVSDAVGAGEGPVVEIGAGTAFYLAKVLTGRPASIGVAVDISVPASRRAAKAHPRAGAVVADAWGRLPLADGSAEAVLVVFAPRGAAELARLLPAGGRLVVATPAPDHLRELVGPLGLRDIEPGKRERLLTTLAPWFELPGAQQVRTRLRLGRSDVLHLASMGPSAFHTDRSELGSRVDELILPADVTLSVTVSRFTRR